MSAADAHHQIRSRDRINLRRPNGGSELPPCRLDALRSAVHGLDEELRKTQACDQHAACVNLRAIGRRRHRKACGSEPRVCPRALAPEALASRQVLEPQASARGVQSRGHGASAPGFQRVTAASSDEGRTLAGSVRSGLTGAGSLPFALWIVERQPDDIRIDFLSLVDADAQLLARGQGRRHQRQTDATRKRRRQPLLVTRPAIWPAPRTRCDSRGRSGPPAAG